MENMGAGPRNSLAPFSSSADKDHVCSCLLQAWKNSQSKDSGAWKYSQPRSFCLLFLNAGYTVMWVSLSGLLSCSVYSVPRSPMLILFHAYECFASLCVPQAVKVRRERASDALETRLQMILSHHVHAGN